MSEEDVAEGVVTHETALIDMTRDASDAATGRILPETDVTAIGQNRFLVGVHGYHELIVVEFALEILIIKVAARIDQRFLVIGLLHERKEGDERIAKSLLTQSARRFHIEHGHQILLAWQALGSEVLQLQVQLYLWTEKMVGAHLEPMTMGHLDVTLITVIDAVATLRSLQIDVAHAGMLANGIPEHFTLIVAQVNTVHMLAGILAGDARNLVDGGLGRTNPFHPSATLLDYTAGRLLLHHMMCTCLGFRLTLTLLRVCIANSHKCYQQRHYHR